MESYRSQGISLGSILHLDEVPEVDNTRISENNIVYDSEWFDIRFMPPAKKMNPIDAYNRFYTTASGKFGSTALGKSYAINPPPQFGRNADIRHGNRGHDPLTSVKSLSVDGGYGRYYSEVFDDSAMLAMFQFGKERFNGISNFIFSAIDPVDATIARTGRLPIGMQAGQITGSLIMLAAFPLITLTIWTLKTVSKFAFDTESFNYYYLEPMMHLYWTAVSQLSTVAATELGMVIPELMPSGQDAIDGNKKPERIGLPYKMNSEDFDTYKQYLPGLITEDNYFDIYAIAVGAQTVANNAMLREYEAFEKGTDVLGEGGYLFQNGEVAIRKKPTFIETTNYYLSFAKFLDRLCRGNGLFAPDGKDEEQRNAELMAKNGAAEAILENNQFTKDVDGFYPAIQSEEKRTYLEKLADAVDAGIKEGGGYAVFNVEYVGSSTETFSNSVENIGLGDTINSVATAAHNTKFNLSGGMTGISAIDALTTTVGNFVKGAVDSISYGGAGVLETLLGNAFVDVMKKYGGSDMSFPTHTFNMKLRPLYNTPFSRWKDEILPTIMILCGVLPLSAGNSSHSSPFICEFFIKGVCHYKQAIITSVNVTRGTSNLPMDKNKSYIGTDISFTVADLSTIPTLPINSSIFDSFKLALEDNRPINKYIATICSRDLLTSKYMIPKMKLKASRLLMAYEQAISPSAWGMRVGLGLNGILGGLVSDHSITLTNRNR